MRLNSYNSVFPSYTPPARPASATGVLAPLGGVAGVAGGAGGVVAPPPLALVDAPPAPAPEPTLDFSGVPHLDQGSQNSCGTTGLAMIMDYLLGRNDITTGEIDKEIRRVDSFGTSPTDLVDYAQEHGLEAGMYNNSSIDEIKQHIAEGHVVQVAIDDPYGKGESGPTNTKDHYLIVTGFKRNPDGSESVLVRDPNGDDNGHVGFDGVKANSADYEIPMDEFMKKWGHTPDGYNNFMIVYAKGGTDLPADRLDGVEHSIDIAKTYWNFRNDLDRVFHPDNFGDFVHGVVGSMGAPFLVTSGVGWAISYIGENLTNAASKWPPVLKNVGMFAGNLIQVPGNIISNVSGMMSGMFNGLGKSFGDFFQGHIGDGFKDLGKTAVGVVKDVANTAVSAVKSVGKAIGSFFGL